MGDLIALIDGRETDLADDGIATLADFLAYADATAGVFNRAALAVLGVDGAPARRAAAHVARAQALVGHLRSAAGHGAGGRVYLPRALLTAHGVSADDLRSGRPPAAFKTAARELARTAEAEIAAARALARDVPRAALPVLVAARFADTHLARLARADFDVFVGTLEPAPLALPLALLKARSAAAISAHRCSPRRPRPTPRHGPGKSGPSTGPRDARRRGA